jgi:hypothetical protein
MLVHTTQYLRLSALKCIQMKVCLQLSYMGNIWRQEVCAYIGRDVSSHVKSDTNADVFCGELLVICLVLNQMSMM